MKQIKFTIAMFFAIFGMATLRVFAQQTPLIEVATGVELFDLSWSPDGQLLAAATSAGIKIFDNNLQEITQLTGYMGYVLSVAWKPDGKQLASGGDPSIRIWDYEATTGNFSLRTVMPTDSDIVALLKWSPDGTKLASLGEVGSVKTHRPGITGEIQFWDADSFAPLLTEPYYIDAVIRVLDWSPDSIRVIGGGGYNDIGSMGIGLIPNTWSISGGGYNVIGTIGIGSTSNTWSIPLNFPPNDISWSVANKVALAADSLYIIDGDSGQILVTLAPSFNTNLVSWNPNGEYLLVQGSNSLDMVDTETNQVVLSFPKPTGDWPWRLAWRSDGKRLAVGTKNGMIQIWDTSLLVNTPPTANAGLDKTVIPSPTTQP